MPEISTAKARGRPKGFDDQSALEAATRVFWQAGYDGASVDQLCRAMTMPRASLYQSYGGKEGLFLATIAHYARSRMGPLIAALGPNGSLHDDMTDFFAEVVRLATADPETPGCLISCVLADAAGTNSAFRDELDRRYSGLETRLADRLRQTTWRADAPVSPDAAAGLAAATARGIMLRARSGQSAQDLAPVAAAAVAALIHFSD
ncbi:MAG: TetR/AcrR family transcriptional regulator [Paracoccaceae bacterium]